MPKISELSIAETLDVSNEDLLILVDKNTNETRKITVGDFIQVIAHMLGVSVRDDAEDANVNDYPRTSTQTCGQTVTRTNPQYKIYGDQYEVSDDAIELTFAYNAYSIASRFVVVARTENSVGGYTDRILFDTGMVSGSDTVTLCKPVNANKVVVFISSDVSSSHSYTLTCTDTACNIEPTQIPVTPTPTSTPAPTPTVTPTSRSLGYIAATPTSTTTPTPTPSITPSITPTISVTPSITPTISVTPSITPTITQTTTPTVTPTTS